MMKKGQLTVEYLIILVAMLLIFSSVSSDLMEFSLRTTIELQTGEMIRASSLVLENSVNAVNLQGPGAKKTVYLRAPSDCDYVVSSSQIELDCEPGSASYELYDGKEVGPVFLLPGGNRMEYSCPACVDSRIESDMLEAVEISKF